MKRWYNRKPETMQDWLLLFAVAAALLAAVWSVSYTHLRAHET